MKKFWLFHEVVYIGYMSSDTLWELGEKSIRELEVETGILASSRAEIYGCIFGRDSLITALSLLRVYERSVDSYYSGLVRKILVNIAGLQGREWNLESGEEPGKIIHEYRTERHEHLTSGERPWFLYPDKIMRNFDSVDSTPLFLMAAHAYFRATADAALIDSIMPNIKAALSWLLVHGDSNGDGLIDYHFHPDRTHGGLVTQSWMDSEESLFFEGDSARPQYPIAPVEVQAYAHTALLDWALYFKEREPEFSAGLSARAKVLKAAFNEHFIVKGRTTSLAFAIDGTGRKLTSPRSSMGHCLFAVHYAADGTPHSVLAHEQIPSIVRRLMSRDLFVRRAGFRTLSSYSRHFDPLSYHNGSIWPHDTALIAEGLANFGFMDEARQVRTALLRAYAHFETPIELFAYANRQYQEYAGGACRVQAWSAASLLTTIAHTRLIAQEA
jgi:glycogen debranching enzyme